jgi:hypothetical protein
MIIRFVADVLDVDRNKVTATFAAEAITEVARQMGMSITDLDHGIWQWQRARPDRAKGYGRNLAYVKMGA